MVARYQVQLMVGATAATTWCSAVIGCGTSSSTDPPGGPGDPGDPGAEIAVSVFPSPIRGPADGTANADLVAFQDGDGPWTAVAGTDGVYRFTVHDERYGVAVGCTGYFGGTAFYYQLVSESSDLAVDGCNRPSGSANVTVEVQGASEATDVWIGNSLGFADPDRPARLTVPRGAADVFVRTYIPFFGEDIGVRVHRGPALDVQDDQRLSIDLTDAANIETYPLTISGPAIDSGLWGMSSSYLTPHARQFRPVQDFFGLPKSYGAVPARVRQPGDLARVEVSETGPTDDATRLPVRSAFQEMATPSAVTLEPPAFLTVTDPAIDMRAVSQLAVIVPILPSKLGHTVSRASFTTPALVSYHHLEIFVRPGWAQGKPSVTLRVPDLRNLLEWSPDMALKARTEVDWSISVIDQDIPLDAPVVDGRRGVVSGVSGKVVSTRVGSEP